VSILALPGWRGSGARPAGHADRIGAPRRAAGSSGSVPPGAFLRESLHAHLVRAALDPAGQSDSVSLRLPPTRLLGVALRPTSPLCCRSRRHRVGVPRR